MISELGGSSGRYETRHGDAAEVSHAFPESPAVAVAESAKAEPIAFSVPGHLQASFDDPHVVPVLEALRSGVQSALTDSGRVYFDPMAAVAGSGCANIDDMVSELVGFARRVSGQAGDLRQVALDETERLLHRPILDLADAIRDEKSTDGPREEVLRVMKMVGSMAQLPKAGEQR